MEEHVEVLEKMLTEDVLKKVFSEEEVKRVLGAVSGLRKRRKTAAGRTFAGFAEEGDDERLEDVGTHGEIPEGFGEPLGTEYCHAVGDVVWVKMKGFPNWPAELLRKGEGSTKKNPLTALLICPPEGQAPIVQTNSKNITYFDKLSTKQELSRCLKYRLMSDKYDTKAYEARYEEAVRTATAMVRGIMTPEATMPLKGIVPVAVAYTNFRAHYQAPRQPSANDEVRKETGVIVLRDGLENLVRDLGKFEWIWVIFQFSYATAGEGEAGRSAKSKEGSNTKNDFFTGWKSMIVPPRDTQLRGLFATRSPHRPNPIGLSCCRLLNVSGRVLTIRNHDLLHGTPILDIKPYLPFCDAHPEANHGWVDELEAPGPDHRWNKHEYTVHRNVPSATKPTSHS
eukprot:TRINITY_DN14134_c0_g1_i1.p1 TRINITY_DN14134_c0_g1~~TRINITY_DN14134_c0_g1_i1.p1  ORF type:complete len:426 (+),score=76.95 TRINITY_DN14134_c0_g1_i1:92-1279(+)